MGMMTRMRDNAHVFIIAFAVVFIAFWVVGDVDIGSALRGSGNELGEINGKVITYQEFTNVVEQVAEQQRKQNNTQDLDENAFANIREQVWNDYVTQAIIEHSVKEFGIIVSDKEVMDWVYSDNPPEVLARYFKDSTGKFNKEQYQQFLKKPSPENEQALVQIEKQLRSDLVRQKLTSMLSASLQPTEGEIREQFASQSQQLNARYVLFELARFGGNNTSAPTDKEYEDYYNEHKSEFKTEELRTLQFVSFTDTPTADDSAVVIKEMQSLAKDAREGKDFLTMVKDYSEQPPQDTWTSRQQIPPDMEKLLFGQPVGTVVGPITDASGIMIAKILETRDGKESLLKAKHILLKSDQDNPEIKKKATDIYNRIKKGESFDALAKQFSEDPGSATKGGELGWFGKGKMVKEFEEASFAAKVGDVVGPVKTSFGYHIIKIEGKSAQEIKYASLKMSVKTSSRTRDNAYEAARNFGYFAQESGFEKEAASSKKKIQTTGEFAKQRGSYIPEIGVNPALLKFSFEGSVGDISEVYRSANGYVVARIAKVSPAGYRPLSEVKEQLTERVKQDRQLNNALRAAQAAYGKLQPGKGLESIIPPDSSLKLVETGAFSLAQGPPIIGKDNFVIGRLAALKPNEISKPFKGTRGAYILQLVSRTPFDETAYKTQREGLRTQTAQQKQSEYISAWIDKMKEKMNIVDNRDKFFR